MGEERDALYSILCSDVIFFEHFYPEESLFYSENIDELLLFS